MRRQIIALAALLAGCASVPGEPAMAAQGNVPSLTLDNKTASKLEPNLCFTARRHAKLNGRPSTATFYTLDGTAKAGVDFVSQRFTISWGASETSKPACVPLINKPGAGPTLTFTGRLIAGTNSKLYDGTAIGSITNPETAPPPVTPQPPAPRTVSCPDLTVREGATGKIVCQISGSNGQASTLTWQIVGDTASSMATATLGVDYPTGLSGQITIPADGAGFSVDFAPFGDALVEGPETTGMTVACSANCVVGKNSALTIEDATSPPPPPTTGKWIARSISPLATLEYVRATAQCRNFLGDLGQWWGAGVPAGTVIRFAVPGDWASVPSSNTVPGGISQLWRGYVLDSAGSQAADAPFVELDAACAEPVAPAQ